MANEEHVAILKQGVKVWNQWREENPAVKPDLSKADLREAHLSRVNFIDADLHLADLRMADLKEAVLYGANASEVDLISASLEGANLNQIDLFAASLNWANASDTAFSDAKLAYADFADANLTRANLDGAYLPESDLDRACLEEAILERANFISARLDETDLTNASCGNTIFTDVNLSTVKGLETIRHESPSSVSIDTLFRSKGKIPEKFLRGCGVPEILIKYLPSMLEQAIQFYSCFISYSHKDQEFARRLHDRLQGAGIRCWLDEHQLNPGDPLHPTIYEAIRVYDKVLLCCSETALKSWWVDKEFNRMIRKEEEYDDFVLIPLNLDGYLFTPECEGWIADDVKQRLVADFTKWKDHDGFETAVKSVIKALRTDGGKLPPPEPKMKKKG